VSPSNREREREYARRRHEKWVARQQERQQQRQRVRRTALTAGGAVVGVLVIVLAAVALTRRDAADPGAALTTTPGASASASPSSSGAAPVASPCPSPTVKPPSSPASFKDVPPKSLAEGKSWILTLATTCGTITAQLDGAKAPQATASAIFLAQKNFWAGTPCHRLTTQGIFVLQCGDPTGTGSGGPGYDFGPVENAPSDGTYPAGTLAMARAASPDSNGSQFFIVHKDTKLPTDGGGYTIFGKVVGGLDVVEKVAAGGSKPEGDGAPVRPISIVSATVAPA
jgi:peptidyl-prolyl cis-trans isomerase B (cyclophilin B)